MEDASANKIFLRFFFIYIIFLVLGAVAVFGIISGQFLTEDKVTTDDIYKEEVLEPSRGSILAYDGSPLAVSIPVYELRWDSKVVADSTFNQGLDSLAMCMSGLFGDKTPAAYRRLLSTARAEGSRYKQIAPRTVDFGELEEIESFPIFRLGQFKGGLIVIKDSERINPYGTLGNRTTVV